ncbi:unnamed protein product [Mycena citricolor]|uniref:FAD/NAD(P)-binding domain-containing protein n=1 Tax=Mycena citricolor TaxID=2018698 RepID=A0AAD2K1Y9_9AGAR|nr:unnamed protein product [Mycena citricolor]
MKCARKAAMPGIIIAGAGVGGLMTAFALKSKLGYDDFVIYEKATDVGGTWRDNIYPGAASDINVHFYSHSADLNPEWDTTVAGQADMHVYWQKLTAKYGIYPNISFGREVVSAEWEADTEQYTVISRDVATGETSEATAKVFISAIGVLNVPRYPNIPGLSSFKGLQFHSARWDAGADLAGKRVAVIGNGASSVQFMPFISKDQSVQVTQFCRTPHYIFPSIKSEYSAAWKWCLRNIPGLIRAYRHFLYFDASYSLSPIDSFSFLRKYIPVGYMKSSIPAKYLDKMIPEYSLGCKRLLFDVAYMDTLHRPNVELNWDGVQTITEDGIITKTGEVMPFDVIIYATGFQADKYPLNIVNDKGVTIQDYFNANGGPQAYLGMGSPGFPNMFYIGGPNTYTGHTSVIHTEELQITYLLKMLPYILSGEVSSFEPSLKATEDYNDVVQSRMNRSSYVSCDSWYRAGGDGKVTATFPGPMLLYWWWVRHIKWSDWVAKANNQRKWDRSVRWGTIGRALNPFSYAMAAGGKVLAWLSV